MNGALESFLKEVAKYVTQAKEPTLFAVGGRGYYENPATDLLGFFLKPQAEHGLGDLFLVTYLDCLKVNWQQFDMRDVRVIPQEQTNEGNYIDLLITGENWCLVIENKIRHWQANPFKDYEAHAYKLEKQKPIFSILSPKGEISPESDANPDRWFGVSYKDYCQKLRGKMTATFFEKPFSKWHVFAREFILHMENELYTSPMNEKQIEFVENNPKRFLEANEMWRQYRIFLCAELKKNLNETFPSFNTKDETWGIRCNIPQWENRADVVLLTPDVDANQLKIRAYLNNVPDSELSMVARELKLGRHETEAKWHYWDSNESYDRKNAIAKLCELVKSVNDILKRLPHQSVSR